MIWLIAASAAAAVLLGIRPAARLPSRTNAAVSAESTALLKRLRGPLAALGGVAGWVLVGGWLGWVAALGIFLVTWRVLGSVESPDSVRRREQIERDLPVAVDLLVAALAAGAAPELALALVAEQLDGPLGAELALPSRRLALGADPASVWRETAKHPQLGPLGRAFGRAHESGGSVVLAGRRLANDVRERQGALATSRAKAVSTKAALPLGLCLLPAFVLIGVVPLVAGLVRALGVLG